MSSEIATPSKRNAYFGIDIRAFAVFRAGLALLVLSQALLLVLTTPSLPPPPEDLEFLIEDALINSAIETPKEVMDMLVDLGFLYAFQQLTAFHDYQGVAFTLTIFFGIGLFFGYYTGWMTLGCFLSFLVLQLPWLPDSWLQGGGILITLLSWSVLFPLGACWSLDSALNNSKATKPQSVIVIATLVLLITEFAQDILIFDLLPSYLAPEYLIWGNLLLIVSVLVLWFSYPLYFRAILPLFMVLLQLAVFASFGPDDNPIIVIFSLDLNLAPFALILMWVLVFPTPIWDRLEQRLTTPQREQLRIYYDGDCGFCKKMVLIIRTFLLPPKTPIETTQGTPETQAAMEVHNSWVVIDHREQMHFKFEALAYVIEQSPLARPIAPLLRWSPIMRHGTQAYQWVASHRKQAARWVKWLRYHRLSVYPSKLNQVLCSLYLIFWALTLMW